MSNILETGYTWRETVYGVFDGTRLVETFGKDDYTDYDGDVMPIVRTYTVTGTRYNRFGDLENTVEYTESISTPCGDYVLESSCDGGTYLKPCAQL